MCVWGICACVLLCIHNMVSHFLKMQEADDIL